MLRPLALAALTLLAFPACDSAVGDAQRIFEAEALTTAIARLNDPEDWRIGPAYTGRYTILLRPTPNPVERTGTVAFDVNVISGGGLRVAVLAEDPLSGVLDFLPLGPGSTCSTAICTFTLSGRQIDYTNEGGLYRLVLLDGSGIVTYGDVEIR